MSSPQSLHQLIELTSNVTDAFTTALFVSDPDKKMLSLAGYHSLSLNLDEKARIAYGDGPIGWVAENEKPYLEEFFPGNSSSLKLYKKKEDLKDFLAVPVMDDELLGVLAVEFLSGGEPSVALGRVQSCLEDLSQIEIVCAVPASSSHLPKPVNYSH